MCHDIDDIQRQIDQLRNKAAKLEEEQYAKEALAQFERVKPNAITLGEVLDRLKKIPRGARVFVRAGLDGYCAITDIDELDLLYYIGANVLVFPEGNGGSSSDTYCRELGDGGDESADDWRRV